MPNCDWDERMTPECPDSIAYSAPSVKMPDTKMDVEMALSEKIGFRNVATTSASPMTRASMAKTVRPDASSRTRASLPCGRAIKSCTVIDRPPFNALSMNSSSGRRRKYISQTPTPKNAELMIAGQKSPLAPQAKNGPNVAIFSAYATEEFRITPGRVYPDETK